MTQTTVTSLLSYAAHPHLHSLLNLHVVLYLGYPSIRNTHIKNACYSSESQRACERSKYAYCGQIHRNQGYSWNASMLVEHANQTIKPPV